MQQDEYTPADCWDPLLIKSSPFLHWTTSNIGEAAPGVHTPLSYTVWRAAIQHAFAGCAHAIGATSKAEHERWPAPIEAPVLGAFYGRVALQVEVFALIGDRLPGTTGTDVVGGILGRVPQDLRTHATRRRYPVIAWRFPLSFATDAKRIRRTAHDTDAWYAQQMATIANLELDAALGAFDQASARFRHNLMVQGLGMFASVEPLYRGVEAVVARTGIGDVGVLSGSGGAEVAGLVADIWKASRGRLETDDVVARHGFHGPMEGQLSSRVWREDDRPLQALIRRYAAEPDERDPIALDAENQRRRAQLTRELLDALPRAQRPPAALLLKVAAERIPLRGVAKRSFLQAIDVTRASARRAGELLAAGGVLDDPRDVFYLTDEELLGEVPRAARDLVARRRTRRAHYEDVSIPTLWTGVPQPLEPSAHGDRGDLRGIGVSAGTVEGTARIVTNPDFTDVEPGEILVAPFTDPSWASIMLVSAGLVVDIGGALSHAAVVARELGLPCVVNTQTGTSQLRTGDRIRVDGATGIVTILAPTPAQPCHPADAELGAQT